MHDLLVNIYSLQDLLAIDPLDGPVRLVDATRPQDDGGHATGRERAAVGGIGDAGYGGLAEYCAAGLAAAHGIEAQHMLEDIGLRLVALC